MASFTLPDNACDAHCHVFGPANQFPFADERKYTPNDAPKAALFKLQQELGFRRAVIVQASCHGTDNRAMLDAISHNPVDLRGVAIIDDQFSDAQLKALHDGGIRGVRFNFLPRLCDMKAQEEYLRIAERIAKLAWHVVVYFEGNTLPQIHHLLQKIQSPLIIDHLGRPDPDLGLNDENFQRVLEILKQRPECFIKVSGIERVSNQGAPYSDAIDFAKTLVDAYPDQVLWGTDWPHPNLNPAPDDKLLLKKIWDMAPQENLRRKLLVDNPQKLYQFA